MNISRTLILLALGGSLLLLAVRRLRTYRLKERYTIVFLLLGLPFLVLAVWPRLLEKVSLWLEIDYRTIMLFCVSTFLFIIVFELLSIVSVQDNRIATLAQMVGILTEKQRQAEEKLRKLDPASAPPDSTPKD